MKKKSQMKDEIKIEDKKEEWRGRGDEKRR